MPYLSLFRDAKSASPTPGSTRAPAKSSPLAPPRRAPTTVRSSLKRKARLPLAVHVFSAAIVEPKSAVFESRESIRAEAIGRAQCRERVCKYVEIAVVAVQL